MKWILLGSLMSLFIPMATPATPEVVITMVPRGKVVEHFGRDFIIKTQAGTKIGIEFNRAGKFEEARGLNLNKGDELEPGEGLISLSSAAQSLVSMGHKPEGYWSLDEDKELGWIYEFQTVLVSAKTGKILKKISESDPGANLRQANNQ